MTINTKPNFKSVMGCLGVLIVIVLVSYLVLISNTSTKQSPPITPTQPSIPTSIPTSLPSPKITDYSTIEELENDCSNLTIENRVARITGIFYASATTGNLAIIQNVNGEYQWLSLGNSFGSGSNPTIQADDGQIISMHSEIIAILSATKSPYTDSCDYHIERVSLLPPSVIPFDKVCSQGEKRVMVLGQLHSISNGLFILCGESCPVELDEIGGSGRILVTHIVIGTGNNKMDPLPDNFNDNDLKIRTDASQLVSVGDKVILTGVLANYSSDDPNYLDCALDVELINTP